MKKHNFFAGPAILPRQVIEKTADAVRDFNGMGLSLLEISHRDKAFEGVIHEAIALFKEILKIPEGYSVLFLGGGANLQFSMVPQNLLKKKAAYLITGVWAEKAAKEAKHFGEVIEVASSADKKHTYIPRQYAIPEDVDYLHITTNNTIYGTELREDITCKVPLLADMSSDIMSRPVDVGKYGLIYAGAQKNLGPSGVTIVIVKNDLVGKSGRKIPTMLDYQTHIKENSLFNTPPVLPIYSVLLTLRWIKDLGGLTAMEKRNKEKSELLYHAIDNSKIFRATVPDKKDRSIMNLCFVMKDEHRALEEEFGKFVGGKGMVGLKGHRSVGGFRASLYNALEIDSVKALVEAMAEFEKKHAK